MSSRCAAGASINEPLEDGRFPLTAAVFVESAEIVRILLAAGSKVDARNKPNQDTALMIAATRGYPEIAKLLLATGAQPNLENAFGLQRFCWQSGTAPRTASS